MAMLTKISMAEARHFGAAFGLKVSTFEPIPHGSVNSNFALTLAGGERAFMRICEESDGQAVALQNSLLLHLVERGVPTPSPLIAQSGASFIEHDGKPVTVFGFCEGSWICQQQVTSTHLRRMGEATAAIHQAGQGFEQTIESRFSSEQLKQRLASLSVHERVTSTSSLSQDVDRLSARLGSLTNAWRPLAQPSVIHGDIFRDNVLWFDGGGLSAIVDFESASHGDPMFDLMVTLLAWCFGDTLRRDLAQALIAGYESRLELTAEQSQRLFEQACAAALRFAVTRISDYELRASGVVVYKDYRRFMARLAALDDIGPNQFASWLSVRGC